MKYLTIQILITETLKNALFYILRIQSFEIKLFFYSLEIKFFFKFLNRSEIFL